MVKVGHWNEINYEEISIDENWNDSADEELSMHTIHAYPAKFPAFIASKAFDYAKDEGVEIKKVADIFCGCGTVALESRNHQYDFWGCDINPVATLIAKTKSCDYDVAIFKSYYSRILESYSRIQVRTNEYELANERLRYWFKEKSYLELLKLYLSIEATVDDEKYQEAYKCLFSSILKASSVWLAKSIKPQVDKEKREIDVISCFTKQYRKFIKALDELQISKSRTEIKLENFLMCQDTPKIDLLITSPPYVTSYEYADLHQLSSLWLNYTDDYRELRKGSIGSIYNVDEAIDLSQLNITAKEIVKLLNEKKCPKSKVHSVARYYLDMQLAIKKSAMMINDNGMIFFVIGDTEYKGVKILNSKHLVEVMQEEGFTDIKICKRTISKGICVPYRDERGKFSKDKNKKKIYHEEFIISGRKIKH